MRSSNGARALTNALVGADVVVVVLGRHSLLAPRTAFEVAMILAISCENISSSQAVLYPPGSVARYR